MSTRNGGLLWRGTDLPVFRPSRRRAVPGHHRQQLCDQGCPARFFYLGCLAGIPEPRGSGDRENSSTWVRASTGIQLNFRAAGESRRTNLSERRTSADF
jgi:hypothetical protein